MDDYPNSMVVDGKRYVWEDSKPTTCWCDGRGGDYKAVFMDADSQPRMVFNQTCVCEKGVEEEARKTALIGDEKQRWRMKVRERAWDDAQIPARFRLWRLADSPVSKALVGRLGALFAEDGLDGSGLESWFLWGDYGVGKTGLAVGYAYEWLMAEIEIEGYASALFRSLPDLLSELRSSYREDGPNEMDLLRTYAEVGLLVLDDFGAEQISGSGWVRDRLYQIIGKRHSELRPIVFTSNLSIPQLADRIGERLTWRIVEMCGDEHLLEVKGSNLRAKK